MKFEINLDHANLPKGVYKFKIRKASLFENKNGWQAISLDMVVENDGPFFGSQQSRLVAIPVSETSAYKFNVQSFQNFMSAIAGATLDGELELEAEEDSEGQIRFSSLEGETFWSVFEMNGQYPKFTDLLEDPSEDAPF